MEASFTHIENRSPRYVHQEITLNIPSEMQQEKFEFGTFLGPDNFNCVCSSSHDAPRHAPGTLRNLSSRLFPGVRAVSTVVAIPVDMSSIPLCPSPKEFVISAIAPP